MEYTYTTNTELYHHGIKGMKWGIRRFQNKDGSLTAAGKKRRAADDSNGSTKAPKKTTAAKPKTKSVSEMTDAEVRDRINRMMLEKQYYDTRRSLAASNPPQVSAGKKFMNSVLNDVVAPAAKEAGRKWLTNFMEDKLGLNKKTELQRLEDTWKKLDYKKKISDLKKGIDDNEDPYGVKAAEALAKRAKADYENADYKNKLENIGKNDDDDSYGLKDLEKRWKVSDYEKKIRDNNSPTKPDKIDWDSIKKEQEVAKERFKTEKAQRSWNQYMEDVAKLGPEEAWERYKKRESDG